MRYVVLALLVASPLAIADDQTGASDDNTGTNVIGSQEAPTVLNVVPWKDREVRVEKQDPSSALLDRVLEPLDQDVLNREIQYHQILSREPDNDGLFLE